MTPLPLPAAPLATPLTVGLVGSTYWPVVGGMQRYLHAVAGALARAGHRVRVATRFDAAAPTTMHGLLTRSGVPRRYRSGGVSVQVLAPDNGRDALLWPTYRLHFYRQTWAAAAWLHHRALGGPLRRALLGCDVLHYSGTGRELLGFSVARLARAAGIPLVITPHTHEGAWGDGPIDVELYRQADAVIALTHYERQLLASRGVPRDTIHVVGHGTTGEAPGDGAAFRARYGLHGPVVLFLGRRTRGKGFGLLLAAAPEIWRRFPDAHIVAVGPEGEVEIPQQLRSDPRLAICGPLSDAAREDALAACDLLCVPSRDEAFGLVYLEAWMYRKPVVALRIPTLLELVGDEAQAPPDGPGPGGLLVEPARRPVAAAVLRLLEDPSLRAGLGAAGHLRAAGRTWDHVAADLAAIYTGALPATPPSPLATRPQGRSRALAHATA